MAVSSFPLFSKQALFAMYKVGPDLLHPLTNIRCVEAKGNLPERTTVFAAVLFQDKIYVALKVQLVRQFRHTSKYSVLYCSSGQLLLWNRLTTFDIVDFGLGAYQGQYQFLAVY